MFVLDLDSEQAMIVVAAMEAANTILSARLHRVDPDGIISNSVIFQQHKINQLREQFKLGSLATYTQLDPEARARALHMAKALGDATDETTREAVYDHLKDWILQQRAKSMPLITGQGMPR